MKEDLGNYTLDEVRKLKGIKLPNQMNTIINTNTYYRIRNNTFNCGPHNQSIVKLRTSLWLDEKTFEKVLQNQWNKNKLIKS